ncbi:DUF2971 domain-containing protein [Enterobacter hormaechei subsp. xiangfangensis]|uniref:DUF2971 domain-containing protein n=3 Tax=Enterobacter hormaechei TaxID=158836 RepID=A0AAP8KR43_9ENTR|nr:MULTISPECIES: DUF2971 domain-containing protein [Enterobacter]CAE7611389.1 hypothetical protein AI2760V1_2539 [Enterobacter cloacae]EJV4343029.1 DUF2971 domain-containing protein [Enterobacter hormaechei]EKW7977015.1 DUF2971 domain-containing protein [Enterobacter hormaechei]ELC7252174.1 DUF2971 domain-containing protein [Enterobacter hormaechei]ELD3283050.1 DUF2971 domain-containing protein [Enterobacter hormaechei]
MNLSAENHLFRFRGDNINTINELVNNSIWHSKISGLNDPFEMFFNFDRDALKQLNKTDIATILKKTKFLEENAKEIERCFYYDDMEPIYKYIDAHWGDGFAIGLLKEFQKSVATACFTKRYDSRLMWGYYGNGMKGICFAYNKEKLKSSGVEFSDVIYTHEAPKINIYKHLLEKMRGEQVTIDAGFSLTKHTDWSGEEEVRSLKYLKGENVYEQIPGFAVPLEKCCVDAVIVGERLAGDMRVFIESFAQKNNIEILIAKADFTNYKIQIESK